MEIFGLVSLPETEENVAVVPALHGGVEHQVVGGGGEESHHQKEVGDQPG